MATDENKTVATTPVWSDEQLASIETFEDALALLADAGIDVTDVTDYGDGFGVLDKAAFVNVPFIILDFKFASGDYGTDFVIARIVTGDRRKGIITDGSTGIREQLRRVAATGKTGGVVCSKGLVVSEYEYVAENGEKTPAKTYYLGM